MSEGPEVHRVAAKLHEEFSGSRLVSVDSRLKNASPGTGRVTFYCPVCQGVD